VLKNIDSNNHYCKLRILRDEKMMEWLMSRKISNFQAIMLVITLLLAFKIYAIEVINHSPGDGSTGNPIDTQITFRIISNIDTAGVDLSTVDISVNETHYNFESDEVAWFSLGAQYEGYSYRFIVDPEVDFGWGDSVSVAVNAEDITGAPMAAEIWGFWVEDDDIDPLVWPTNPFPGEEDVNLNQNIIFDITDGNSGVVLADVSVHLVTTASEMDETYSIGTVLTYLPIGSGWRFTLDPVEEFVITDTVTVTVTATDAAENEVIEEYSFYAISSFDFTYTGNYSPNWDQTNVLVDTSVRFNIYNMLEDVFVDTLTIVVLMQGQQYTHLNEDNFQLEPILGEDEVNIGYQVTILPYNTFNYNRLIMVQIDATATDEISMETVNYSFRTVSDNTAPSTSAWSPYPDEEEVVVETSIYFQIKDLLSGVNIDSVTVWIDSLAFNTLDDNFAYDEIEEGYEVTITPLQPFNSTQVVDVVIEGEDNLDNEMSFAYSFTCELLSEDENPPFLWDINPIDGAINVPIDGEISFYVFDSDPGVNPDEIRLYKGAQNVTNQAVIEADLEFGVTELGNPIAYHVVYQLNESNPGVINWRVEAEDFIGNVYNEDESETFSFTCVESTPPYINLPEEFVFMEDDDLVVNFSAYANDPDGIYPDISFTGDDEINIAVTNDSIVTFSAPLNWWGEETITFEVNDGSGFAEDEVLVRVIAVNDPPVIDVPDAGYTLVEDHSLTDDFTPYVSDIDGDELFLQASGMDQVIIMINGMTVTISAVEDWFGIENITFTVYDNSGRLAASDTVPIEFTDTGESPVLTLPAQFIFEEDGSLVVDFTEYIYEPDGEPVTLTYSGAGEVNVDIDSTTVTFTADADWWGEDEITFLVSDNGIDFIPGETTVRVISVNDAPVLTLPLVVDINEDEEIELDFSSYVSDVDGEISYLNHIVNEYVSVSISNLLVTLTPDEDWNGETEINIIASDPTGASVLGVLNVNVIPINDLPVIDLPPYFSFNEDSTLEIDLNYNIQDIDGDVLFISVMGAENINYELTDMNLELSAEANWNGNEWWFISVDDGDRVTVSDSVQVIVIPVNDEPVVQLPVSINFDEDTGLQINFIDSLYITDIDEDDIEIIVSGTNSVISQVAGDVVIFSAVANWNGSENVTILAVDNNGGVSSGEMIVTINAVNDAPEINLPGEISFAEGTGVLLNMEQFLTDVDLDDLESMEVLNLSCTGNENVTIDIDQDDLEVTFGSVPDWNGMETLTFTVTDFEGLEDSDEIDVEVSIWQNNHAPELELELEPDFDEDDFLVIDFVLDSLVVDIDGDELLVSILNNVHIQAEEDGAVVTFTADENWNGIETVDFFVDDQNGGFCQGSLNFTVNAVDDLPILELPAVITFEEGPIHTEDMSQYITDVDDDVLTLTWDEPDTLTIDMIGYLTVSMQGPSEWTGSENVTFYLYDGETTVSSSVDVLVTLGAGNHAPQLIGLPESLSFDEDTSISFDFTNHIYDPDEGDEFILQVSNNNDVLYQIVGLEVILTADPNWSGDESLIFTVFDTQPVGDRADVSEMINIIVNPVNDVPTIELPEFITFEEGNAPALDFSIYLDDVDGGTPMLEGESGENVFIDIVGLSTITFSASEDWTGEEMIYLSVTDGESSATDSLLVQVTESSINNPPVITEAFPDSVAFDEDTQYVMDFAPFVTDEDGDEWVVIIAGNTDIFTSVTNNVVTFSCANNWNGEETLDFTVLELLSRASVPGSIDVIVHPINDAPLIDLPGSRTIGENEQLVESFTDFISDIDGDNITLEASANDTIQIIINQHVVQFIPMIDWYGTQDITFTVYDDSLSASDVIEIIVEEGDWNNAPVMTLPDEIVMNEDEELEVDFSQYIDDEDDDPLVLTSEHNEAITIIIEGLMVTFIPNYNYNGYEDIDFYVYDTPRQSRLGASDEVRITVNSVNDDPVLDMPDIFTFEESSSLEVDFSYYVYDPDEAIYDLSWENNSEVNIVSSGYQQITLSASAGWSGSEFVEFTARDGHLVTAVDTVEIIVNEGVFNTAPEIVLPDSFLVVEDTVIEYDFSDYISDEDEDQMMLAASYSPNIAVVIVDSTVTFRPSLNYFGAETITFTVYDTGGEAGGGRANSSADVEVVVAPVNDAPTIDAPASLSFSNSDPFPVDFAGFINDVDGEILELTATGNTGISVMVLSYQVVFDVVDEFSGSENIEFTVTDSSGLTASDIILIQAISGNVNTPPVIVLPDEFEFAEDSTLEIDFEDMGYIDDIDEDDILSLLVYGAEHLIVDISGTEVTLSAAPNWYGEEELSFYVFDDIGRETASDEVNVIVTPVNDAPEINLPPELYYSEGEGLYNQLFSNYISDVDAEDELTLSVTGNINIEVEIFHLGMNIIQVNISSELGFYDTEVLTFTVTDNDSLSASDDIDIVVEEGSWNHAPEFTSEMPTGVSIKEDTEWVADFTGFITDAEDDDIVLQVDNVDNMDVIIDGLEVIIRPDANWYGNTVLHFIAYDTIPLTRASVEADMDFIVRPQNDDPVLNLPDYLSFVENDILEVDFANYAQDIDGDELSISWENNEYIDIEQGAAYKVYLNEDDFVGVEAITFTVTDDSTGFDTNIVSVEVLQGQWNHAPAIVLPDQLFMDEDIAQQFDFGQYISDIDVNDQLIITAAFNENIAVSIMEDTLVTLIPAANFNGSVFMTFNVIDNVIDERETASDVVEIVINPINDAPTIELPDQFSMTQTEQLFENFFFFVDDVDGDALLLTAGGANHLDISIQNFQVTIVPLDEIWWGDEEITFTVSDPDTLSATDSMTIWVYQGSTNTPPEIDLPDTFTFREDEELVIDFMAEGYISDDDPDDVLFISVTGNHDVIVEIEGFEVTISAEQDWFGSEEMLFYVFDDMSGRSTASDNVEIIVTSVNDAPSIVLPAEFVRSEDDFTPYISINLDQYIDDIDSPFYSLEVSGEEHLDINVTEGTFTMIITLLEQWAGTDTITFTVTDDSLATSYDTANITITPGEDNHPPTIVLPDSFGLFEDQQNAVFDFTGYVNDIDGDDIVIQTGNYEFLEIDINQIYVTITPEPDWFGSQRVDFVVWDTEGRASATDFVDVIVAPVNDIPVMVLPDSIIFEENSQIEVDFEPYLQDVDGDQLTISWELTDSIDVSNFNYEVSFTAFEDDWYGSEMITFNAADSSDSVTDSVMVVIERGNWNHEPEFDLPDEGWEVAEDEQLILDFTDYAYDEDGDALRIFYTYNPLVDILLNGMEVTLNPAADYFGTIELEFSLMDNVSRFEVFDSASLVVTPVNDAPTISLPDDFLFVQTEGLYKNFTQYIDDIDNETLTLSYSGTTNISVEITEETMVHFYLEDEEWSGDETITFTVSDMDSLTASDDVLVQVIQGITNTPPEINLPASLTFEEDMSFQRDFEVEGWVWDDDYDQLELTVSGNENITVEINGTFVNMGALANWNGTELLTFWVIDEQGQAESGQVPVIVEAINDAPFIEFPANGFSFLETSSTIEILDDYFYDVDGDDLGITYSGNENVIVEIDSSGNYYVAEFSAVPDWTESEIITFTVRDIHNVSASAEVTIDVIPGEFPHAPEIYLPETLSFLEDESYEFDLTEFMHDVDGDYIVVFPHESAHINISIAPDTMVTLSADANWNGTETVVFEIHDSDTGTRLSAYGEIEVTVESVNDVPVLNLPELIEFDENTTEVLDFNLFVSDADEEVLAIEYSGEDTITVNIVGYSVFLDSPDDWTGEEWITFTVTDSVVSIIDSTLVRVLMGEWNHAPEINLPVEGFTLAEDTELEIDFDLYTSDPDGDNLIITSVLDPDIAVMIAGNMVTFAPAANFNGTKTLTFEVIDNIGAGRFTATGQVDVIVTPVNDPPTFVLPQELGISRDIPRYEVFNQFIFDIDEDDSHTLEYTGNQNIQISVDDLQVTFNSSWIGSEIITFTVSDLEGATASDSIEVIVYAGQANNAPEITLPDLISFNEDETLQVDFNEYIFDQDYDDLSLLVTGNSMITADIQPNELVNFSAASNWSNMERLTFIVSDNYTFTTDFVDVQVIPINDAPTLDLPYNLSFSENSTLDIPFYLYMTDVDGDILNINYSGNDNIGVELILTTVRLSCSGWFGDEVITFTVDDGELYSEPGEITITVLPGVNNHAPVIEMPASFTTNEDEVLIIDMGLYVSDQDDDQLIFEINGEINTNATSYGYDIYIDPDTNWNGTETLTFIVYDNVMRASASDVVDIIVTPVNDDPEISLPLEGFSFAENSNVLIDFSQYVNDVDGNQLSLSCSGNLNVIPQINNLSVFLEAEPYWSGTETLTFTIDDQYDGIASDSVTVTVDFINDAPYVAAPIEYLSMQEDIPDTSINLNDVFADHDLIFGDYLTYSWFGDMNMDVAVDSGAVTITPDLNWNGDQTLTFRATDSEELFVEESVFITITPINDIPVVITEGSITAQADSSGFANVWLSANGSYDVDGEIVSVHWSWDENGGGSVEGMVVQQAFAPGYYVIDVEATDNLSGEGTATTYLSVAENDNLSPIAWDDYYVVYETEALIIHAANGVLANDQDPDNYPEELTAVLVSDVSDGILQEFADTGSFIFLAEDIEDHDVVFTYQAYDGDAYSLIRTVYITVEEIVLDDAEITINSIDSENGVNINVPILTSDLLPDWDVRSFDFDLQFTDGVVQYSGYDLDSVIVDTLGTVFIEQTRGNLHCTYNSTEVITGAGALLNLEFFYNLGQTPLQITNFSFNDTEIEQIFPGAVNNHFPQLSSVITFIDTIFEDFDPIYIDLDEHFTDLDEDELFYTVSYDEDEITAVVNDNILELSSVYNYSGQPGVTLTATDGYTLTEPEVYTFHPDIIAQNDPPVIDLPLSITFPEDDSLVVNMDEYVFDPDIDILSFSWSASDNIEISADIMALTFSSIPDWNGTETITIDVSDGVTGRVIASDSFDVIVTPVNDPPILTLPLSFPFDEDETYAEDFVVESYVSDPDGDPVTLTVSGNTNIIIDIVDTQVTISAPANWNGTEDVMFYAQDDQGTEIDSMGTQIIVRPMDDAPVIMIDRTILIDENSTADDNDMNFADSLWIYDVDGDILELIVDDGIEIDIVIDGSNVTFEPQENFVGVEERTFSVSDDQGATWYSDSVDIIVLETQGNRPPEILLPPEGFTYAEDEQLVINFADTLTAGYVSDPDDDPVGIFVFNTENITASMTGLSVTLGTTEDFFGADEVIIHAYDDITRATAIDTFLVTVTPVNDPPEIDLPDNIVMMGDTTRFFPMGQYLFDIDNDVNDLTLEASGYINVGVEIINTTVVFSSPEVWEGEETIYFSVFDGGAIPAMDSLVVKVEQEAINHTPDIDLPANFNFNEDEELIVDFAPYVSDPDDDEVFISALPNDYINVSITELQVTLTAIEDWYGMETVTFMVYDSGSRLSASDDIQVNVTAVNDPPRFDPIYDFIMEIDQTLEVDFANYVSDLEGDSFSLSLSIGVGINITQAGTKFTIIPEADCPAMQTLTLTATENTSGIFSEISFGLFVKAPAVDLAAITNAVNSGMFTFYENSGDHTIDFSQFLESSYDITLSSPLADLQTSDSLTVSIDGFNVSLTPQNSWIGTIYVPFTVTYLYDRARRDFEVKITVRATKSGEDVVPLPHTVTWMDPECVIRIDSGESPNDISGKILNRRGRLIKEFSSEPERLGENRFIYHWYKDDKDGNPVDGGLYIYRVDISGKIYQGTIIIVR
jgi:large repetitive protein